MNKNWTSILSKRTSRYLAKMLAAGNCRLEVPVSNLDHLLGTCAGHEVDRGLTGQWLVVESALFAGWTWVRISCDNDTVVFRASSQSSLDQQPEGVSFVGRGRAVSGFVHALSDREALWVWVSKGVPTPRVTVYPVPARIVEGARDTPVDLTERGYDLYRAKTARPPAKSQGSSQRIGVMVVGQRNRSEDLLATLYSLAQQSYRPFRVLLCAELADQASQEVIEWVENFGSVRVDSLGLPGLDGEYLVSLTVGDRLAPRAIEEYDAALTQFPEAKVLYADDDLIDSSHGVVSPEFKPAFSPLLLSFHDYIAGSCCVAGDIWYNAEVRGVIAGTGIVRDLIDEEVVHIPKVLHHRISRDIWRAPSGDIAMDPESLIDVGPHLGTYRDNVHRYSILIPTAAKVSLVERCLTSIAQMSRGADYEVLLDINGANREALFSFVSDRSDDGNVRVVDSSRKDGEGFNYSKLINGLARQALGDILVILNDDTEVMTPGWLDVMGEYLSFSRAGLVGPKLIYPRSGRVQYGGGVLGASWVAAHAYVGVADEFDGEPKNLVTPREVATVTGAAMAVRAEVFHELDELDEVNLAVSYSDVDLCLKSLAAGYRNLFLPQVIIGHNETATRVRPSSVDERHREAAEFEYARQKWGMELLEADPYYNSNLTLTYEEALFNLASFPRDLGPRSNQIRRTKN